MGTFGGGRAVRHGSAGCLAWAIPPPTSPCGRSWVSEPSFSTPLSYPTARRAKKSRVCPHQGRRY